MRLHSEAELARDALAAPLVSRAARLARWAGPDTRVGVGGELVEEQLPAAAETLGLIGDGGTGVGGAEEGLTVEDALACASEAWRVAVDTGLVEVVDEDAGTVTVGEDLALLTSGAPHDVLAVWLGALETVLADASVPDLDDLVDAMDDGTEVDFSQLDWDPEAEADFLDGVLANLYLLSVSEGGPADGPVPLPALAASMVVPGDMSEPTNDVLEQISDTMMRLDDQFRLLEPIGLVAYRPLDEALMADTDDPAEGALTGDDTDVSRYGMVRLTPLGLYGVRARLLESGFEAPAVGDLADKGADALLDGTAAFPATAAQAETEQWLARREPLAAARELLAAARVATPVRRCAGCSASRPCPSSAPRPSPRCGRSSTTPNWAGSPASGSASRARRTCRRRPRRWCSG